jgi:RsiW-degrading membrane proteinase PrsW (M82 family)
VGATPDKYVDPASTAACAKSFNWRVEGAFATAVILHVLWDTFASIRSATFVRSVSIEFVSLLIAFVSLTLLIRRVREARRAAEIVGDAGGGVT